MIDKTHRLSLTRQGELLDLSRDSLYYRPVPSSAADLALMRRIDELHLEFPFAGSRMLRDLLNAEGVEVGRKHVATLMRVFVERLWRSVKYEYVYLHAYESVSAAKTGIGKYLAFFNTRRPHTSLDRQTPDTVYFQNLPLAAAA